ncbi:hypothetical protein PsorP6_014324 [Peronosclerospora sorghi]|uniref:Uncharacterized protein n=1 Tax=Peronosclerospora sorghi TaxID=230839 RepID=A0ACC0VFP7_9STRA|nr:hypothetical protein PsorP6_014324 [Peronosclerospora sorghi]
MPILLRPTAPSPSIDELTATVTAAPRPRHVQQRSVSSAVSEPLWTARSRRRCSTADIDFSCKEDACTDPEHRDFTHRLSQSLRQCKGVCATKKDKAEADFRDSKHSSRATQPDEDHISCDGSFAFDSERVSCVLSCCCSHADANELGITSSCVVIEDQQLAVVDKELRNLRQNLVRKFYSRLTKFPSLRRKKPSDKSTS